MGTSPWDALQHASSEVKARWQALWLEEYRSMRSESEQARNAQQTILQWSLGSFAAIIAGSLVMFQGATSQIFKFTGEVGTILMYILGFGLPGLGLFAYLVWWGEFLRMERAGRYTRGLELVGQRFASYGAAQVPPPLQWEHFLAGPVMARGRNKQMIGYVGTVGIYFGFSVSALILFISLVLAHVYHLGSWGGWVRGFSLAWPGIFVIGFIFLTWYLKRLADHQSRQGVLLEDILPPIEFVVPTQAVPETPAGLAAPVVASIELDVAVSVDPLPLPASEQEQSIPPGLYTG
jgi:hypothetical protein